MLPKSYFTGSRTLSAGLVWHQAWRILQRVCFRIRTLAVVLALIPFASFASGSNPDLSLPAMCERAATQASAETGVPISVLKAISLTETGRKRGGRFVPWPWTVNMEGKGAWFDTEDEARAFVYKHYKAGARSFDIGCFQINYRWHGKAFASIEEMFDPLANARYAAGFLKGLYAEIGDWGGAAGAYHSRTKEFADRYQARFEKIRARVADGAPEAETPPLPVAAPTVVAAQEARVNAFPLLKAGGTGQMGSLFPTGAGAAKPLFASAGAEG